MTNFSFKSIEKQRYIAGPQLKKFQGRGGILE